jgi:hypothetical protein
LAKETAWIVIRTTKGGRLPVCRLTVKVAGTTGH